MADDFLTKALRGLSGPRIVRQPVVKTAEGRGTVSGFVLGTSPLQGQPYPEQASGDASGLISRQRMREIVLRTPTAAASINAILDFAGGVKIGVRNVDPSKPVPKMQSNLINRLLRRPNSTQTKRQWLLTLMRDIATFGYGAVELVPTGSAIYPVEMWVMDGARLKIDFDEHGYTRGYDMLSARGTPIIDPTRGGGTAGDGSSVNYDFPQGTTMGYTGQVSYPAGFGSDESPKGLHGWSPEEVMMFSLNPISESVYPYSRIVQLFTAALLEDLMLQFISERFTDSNIPFGVFDLGDVSETELRIAIDNWNTQGRAGNRILMTGSKGAGSKWLPFGYHLKDLEATQLLSEVRMKIMGVLGVTMAELGESQDINKANGYNLSFTFKKRAVEPMLDEVTETLTKRLLWDTLGYTDLELYYEEIDSRDDFLMSQIDTNYMKLGLLTPNEIRNRRGLISVDGGEEAMVFTGNSWIPMNLVRKLAEGIVSIESETSAIGVMGPEGTRVRAAVNQPGTSDASIDRSGALTITHSAGGGSSGKTTQNGHDRGATSEMQRQLAGK